MKYNLMFQTPCKHRTFSYMVYYFLKMYLFSFMFKCVLQCMYVFHSTCMQCSQQPEGGIRSSGAGGRVVSLLVDAENLALVFYTDNKCP